MVTFGEPLGHVITLCGQILVSRTDDDPLLPRRVWIQNVPVCTTTPRVHVSTHVRVVPAYTGTFVNVHTEAFLKPNTGFSTFFQRAATHTNTHTPRPPTTTTTHNDTHHTTQHTTSHGDRERETERDRERRQREKTEKERQDKTRQEKTITRREDKRR